MPSTVFDSAIFRDAFGTEAMRSAFCDERFVAEAIRVEVALAAVQGRLGIIPSDAAAKIAASARADAIDYPKLKAETDNVGYPILGLVHQLAKMSGDAGRYLHWGATTQDIYDTATVLQMKAAFDLVAAELDGIDTALADLAAKHRGTVMAGRTHLQHALPVTLGHKAAVWLTMIRRHRQRLSELRPRVEVVQFGGAAGTLASLGTRGLEVHDGLASELGLGRLPMPWHVARDGFAESVSLLALITGTLAKIATDVMLMMQTEVGEAFEPFVPGRGGSSTMPQKRNPISCEFIIALARIVRQHAGLMMDAMVSDHERGTGPWQIEWVALPEAFVASAGALGQSRFLVSGLIVDPERMRRNLAATGGLIVSEAVMMALAPHLGRGTAHDVVYGACRAAATSGTPLIDELHKSADVTRHFDDAALKRLVDPANYLGVTDQMIDRALASK
jgi:3-carboxy-cis,cis-muconate cycloisomerase